MIEIEFISLRRKIIENDYKKLNDRQKEAVFTTDGPILILAGAGSGKTTVIINKIYHLIKYGSAYSSTNTPDGITEQDIELLGWYSDGELDELSPELAEYLCENPVKPYNILAITFTNKAAGESESPSYVEPGEMEMMWRQEPFTQCAFVFCAVHLTKSAMKRASQFTILPTSRQ